jgi:hypothetical protein
MHLLLMTPVMVILILIQITFVTYQKKEIYLLVISLITPIAIFLLCLELLPLGPF